VAIDAGHGLRPNQSLKLTEGAVCDNQSWKLKTKNKKHMERRQCITIMICPTAAA